MKNLLIPTVCLLCCFMSAQSCNTDSGEMRLGIERDTTLAGSVSFVNPYYFTAECTYDGKVLDGFIDYMSMIDVHKCTDSMSKISPFPEKQEMLRLSTPPTVALSASIRVAMSPSAHTSRDISAKFLSRKMIRQHLSTTAE